MAFTLGQGVINISANLAPLRTALVSARYQLSSFVAGTRTLSQVAGFLTGNFLVSGVIALTRVMMGAGQAAADMGETINKLQVIFGEASTEVRKFADDMADSLGYSKQQVLDAASAFGAMGRGAGLTAKQAAEFGEEMVKLAIDVRSVENIPFATAVRKLQSGLAGTTRPLREYGLLLSADMVKQEAYRLGIAKTGEALSEQAKVMARASLEFKKAQFAQGDAAATAESTANLQVAALGRITNAYTKFGEALLPIWHGLASGLNSAARAIDGFVKANGDRVYQWAASVGESFAFMKGEALRLFERIRPAFAELITVFSRLWGSLGDGRDIFAAMGDAFAEAIIMMTKIATGFLKIIEKIRDGVILFIDGMSGDMATFQKHIEDIQRLGHIDFEVPNVPFVKPEEPKRDEGKFGEGGLDKGEDKSKKGDHFTSFEDFWQKLQAGAADTPKKQLAAQEEGNQVLNKILGELTAGGEKAPIAW